MERHEPSQKHYIPIKISDDTKMKSRGDPVSLGKYPISMRSAFDDLLYLTSRDIYVAIFQVLPIVSRMINRTQKKKMIRHTNPCCIQKKRKKIRNYLHSLII